MTVCLDKSFMDQSLSKSTCVSILLMIVTSCYLRLGRVLKIRTLPPISCMHRDSRVSIYECSSSKTPCGNLKLICRLLCTGHLTGSSAATNSSSESPRYRPAEGVLGKFRDSYGHLLRRRPPPPKQLSLDSGERHYTDQPRRSLEWNYR